MENCSVKILEKETNKKRALSLSVKMQLLEAVDEGKESKTNICKRFGIPNSTLSTILKSREKISTAFETSKFEGKRKRLRVSNHENLDAALLTWYKQTKGQNLPVSGPILMDKAVALAVELGINFNCNVGWLHRFKQRNNITFKNSSKEKNGLVENTTFEWFSSTLPNILKDFYPSNIFSAAVTGVFYKCLPDKAPKMKGSRCGGGEKSKHRMTILLGCNMDGSEKIPLLVIGKYLKPRCFKNVKSLPLDYTANKNAWMTSNIFTGWLVKLDKYFAGENRQIALIVDNCLAHPHIGLNLRAIKLVFLPPNTTSVLQPCNQGIIQSFKFFYRKCLMQKYLTGISVKEDFQNLSVLDALHLIRTAWNSVSQQTMKNCFTNAKFNLPEGAPHEVFGEQLVVLVENNIDLSAAGAGNNNNHNNKELLEIPKAVCVQENPTAAQDFEKIYQLVSVLLDVSSTDFTFNDYIVIDNDLVTAMMSSDSEIVESGKGKVGARGGAEEDDDDDSDDSLKLPTAPPNSAEMLDVMKTLRRFLESRQDGAKMYDTLAELEQYVEQEIVFGSKQKKIAQILNSKRLINQDERARLIKYCVYPLISYGVSIWYPKYDYLMTEIYRALNKIIRLSFFYQYQMNISPLYDRWGFLKPEAHCRRSILMRIDRLKRTSTCFEETEIIPIQGATTRSVTDGKLKIKHKRGTYSFWTIKSTGPLIFNAVPQELRDLSNYCATCELSCTHFKKQLKTVNLYDIKCEV